MRTFHAMSTEVAVAAPALDDAAEQHLAEQVAARFAETERRFSRFRADSELTRLNRATGPIVVSTELLELLLRARRHVAETDGLFDPAVGAAVCAAGYDRSFVPGALDRGALVAPRRARLSELGIDELTRTVTRPVHVQLDLGGFLKGLTVDRAAASAPAVACIDAGGDAVLRGAGLDGAGWLVDIEDPACAQRAIASLRVRDRAVATSAPNRRHWRAGSGIAHHLIDPRTSLPSTSDLAQVTVIAPTAERADVLAKVGFLLGVDSATRVFAATPDIGAVLVARDGAVRFLGDLEVCDA
jgi:thiamine biosynthesis lipoprotein